MNAIERILLDSGLSWTMSKLLPYIFMVLLGILLIFVFKKSFKQRKWLNRLFRLLLFVVPFAIYFMVSPIYEGDFSSNSSVVDKGDEFAELTGQKLVVISIPNCPYCYEAIDRMHLLKKRVENANIEYVICSSDEQSTEWYKEKAGDEINVRLADSIRAMNQLAEGRYPTFILVDNKKPLKRWSNDDFGVVAMDEVELLLK